MEFLFFVLVSLVAIAGDVVLMSETVNLGMVAGGLGVLVPMPDRQPRWIDDLGIFPIVCKTMFDHVQAFLAFCLGQDVDWSCVDLNISVISPLLGTREVTGSGEKQREADGRLVHHKCSLLSITVY